MESLPCLPVTSSSLASRLNERRRPEPSRRWLRVAIAVLATVGAIDTGVITLKRWGILGPILCPGGSDGCDKVLNSVWGSLFGQPLALFGCLAYLAVLFMAVLPLVLPGEARGELNSRSWWGLALLTTAMAVFSLVLLGLMVFKIQAFCPFCLLSALLSLTLMVLSLVGGAWEDRGQLLFRVVMTALAVAVVSLGWATAADRPASVLGKGMPRPVVAKSSPAALALADQLSKKGAVMYSAYWCPHCHDQKELFGKQATAKLNVVECAPDGQNSQAKLCATKGIKAFPSWEINGKIESGVKPLAKLAEMIGYKAVPGL